MSETLQLTTEMMVVLGFLAFTICMFVIEVVRIDLAAIIVMVLLGMTATQARARLAEAGGVVRVAVDENHLRL